MLIYIRHTSVDVPPGVCYGATDVALAPTFAEEAAAVRERLAPLGVPDLVFSSPLSRCTRLAAACGYPDAIRDPRLQELDFGEWEMQRFDEITDPRLQEWYADWQHVAPTRGESYLEQQERLRRFLAELPTGARGGAEPLIFIFTHGGIIAQARILGGMEAAEAYHQQTPYGGVEVMK